MGHAPRKQAHKSQLSNECFQTHIYLPSIHIGNSRPLCGIFMSRKYAVFSVPDTYRYLSKCDEMKQIKMQLFS